MNVDTSKVKYMFDLIVQGKGLIRIVFRKMCKAENQSIAIS